jgi:hypothetical protein
MEISDVRRQVHETIERARRQAAARRTRNDEASRVFETFLELRAIPLMRQIANVLKIESYAFTVATPSGAVRLMSDRSGDDFIELALDTSGEAPAVVSRVSHTRGRRVISEETIVGAGDPDAITEEELLGFILKQLEPFVER